jgi:hypothetical protein
MMLAATIARNMSAGMSVINVAVACRASGGGFDGVAAGGARRKRGAEP